MQPQINEEKWESLVSQKEFGRLHYSSSPDRGLDNILYLLPWVKEKIPEVHLHVWYGFHNWESAVKSRNNQNEMKQLEGLQKQIEDAKDYVTFHGRINQVQLAKEWKKSYLWFYPSQFTESFCLTAKEAQLSATPILCSNVAALETTVGDWGIRVNGHPYSKESREEFLRILLEILSDRALWEWWSRRSFMGAEGISWQNRWDSYWSAYL